MNPLLVEIPTKNRVRTLGRCLAALLGQAFQEYDLLITNDNPALDLFSDPVTSQWLNRHQAKRQVWLEDGLGIGQVYSHNMVLFERPWRDYEFILRLDDDVLLDVWAIQNAMNYIKSDPQIGAVSGLWFENEINENWHCDRDVPSAEDWQLPELDGRVVDGIVSNWHQRLYLTLRPNGPMQVEHLYGPWMYRPEAMRRAGGFPEIFSKGVHHGMETDASYRLFLSGYDMYVLPTVTGQHLRSAGGIRSAGVDTEHHQRQLDDPIRNSRLRAMPGKYRKPIRVALWSQHAVFCGGGPRLTFELASALESSPYFDVYMVEPYMDLKLAGQMFGVSLKNEKKLPEKVDVLIQMGDDLDWFDHVRNKVSVPEARSKLFFTFYPFGQRAPDADEFCQVVTLSDFVVGEIAKKWRLASRRIYPVARKIKRLKKKNWILVVGRIDQWKGTLWLMERFAEWDLDGWELHVLGATEGSQQASYIDQVFKFADGYQDIYLHCDISQVELEKFYGRAKILLAAKGMLAEPDHLQEAEHYGLTPLEAISAGCVPLVYDLGGHRETTPVGWRWKTEEELHALVSELVENGTPALPNIDDFLDRDLFYEQWERLVLQANAEALKLESVDDIGIQVFERPKLAIICDTPPPRKYTGFGVVAGQIVPAFVKEGFDVYYYAILDDIPAMPGEFDFTFWPMQTNDPQGEKGLVRFLNYVKPDVIWSLYDPGSLFKYLIFREYGLQARRAGGEAYPMVVYFPVEGKPCPGVTGDLIEYLQKNNGKAITYCQAGADTINEQFGLDVDYIHHGLDHAEFRPYDLEERRMLRRLVGLDEKFVVGSFGINKRVKQYDLLVYAASILKDMGEDEDIVFYLHTEPDEPILQGYPLRSMVKAYGVEDMFIWKPDTYKRRGGKYIGAAYDSQTVKEAARFTQPTTPEARGFMFGHFDIISRYNVLDLYVDCSSVEGWNLPLGEALKCGVPGISVADGLAREDIYHGGVHFIKPEPKHFSTWHHGARLEVVDPQDIAKAILLFKNNPGMGVEAGLEVANKYTWEPCRKKMVAAVKEVLGRA